MADTASLTSLARDRVTLAIASCYVVLGSMLGVVGPVSDKLRSELGFSGVATGLHGAMFGWCLIVSGLSSTWILRRVDEVRLLRGSLVGLTVGISVQTLGTNLAVTLGGAALVGASAAGLVLVAPHVLALRHRAGDRTVAFTFVNALAQLGNAGAPLLLAVALRVGWGWRWPVVFGALVVGVHALVAAGRTTLPRPPSRGNGEVSESAIAVLRRLPGARRGVAVVALGVAVEFATLVWGSTSLQELAGASAAVGAAGIGVFGVGMLLGRLFGVSMMRRADEVAVLRCSFAVTAMSTLLVRLGPGVGVRLGAIAVTGLAVSLMYPLGFARLYGAGVPEESVGAVGALASGIAISVSPPLLGVLADILDLATAMYLVPVLALLGLVMVGRRPVPALDVPDVL